MAGANAIYTMISKHVAEELCLEKISRSMFRIANSEVAEYSVSEAYIVVEDRDVVFVFYLEFKVYIVMMNLIYIGVSSLGFLGII